MMHFLDSGSGFILNLPSHFLKVDWVLALKSLDLSLEILVFLFVEVVLTSHFFEFLTHVVVGLESCVALALVDHFLTFLVQKQVILENGQLIVLCEK